MRRIGMLLAGAALLAALAYIGAGFRPPPVIQMVRPAAFVGLSTPVEITVQAPGGRLSSVTVELEQNGAVTPHPAAGEAPAPPPAGSGDQVLVLRQINRETVPTLASGPARLVVRASRTVAFGLRTLTSEVVRDIQVRLERPRLEVLSTHHYVNLGGSEAIVYRVQPADVSSGVVVGDTEYPGYPASGATVANGGAITDPAVRIAFFALRFDQAPDAPMHLYARDEAGNSSTAAFEHRVFPKTFRKSTLPLDDRFLDRVVPAILAGAPGVGDGGSTLEQFLAINGDLRTRNNQTIQALAGNTAAEMLWQGDVFYAFVNNAVESAFADRRTYTYEGRLVDQQTHLGFDLASVAHAPVLAANHGRVLMAEELGIYGNCVVLDHGMGVQSLYGHLSSLAVQPGAGVRKGDMLGRTGTTGLAGGDHLHFTMLVNGQMVNPVEWWDPHWIEDRVLRKLREAR